MPLIITIMLQAVSSFTRPPFCYSWATRRWKKEKSQFYWQVWQSLPKRNSIIDESWSEMLYNPRRDLYGWKDWLPQTESDWTVSLNTSCTFMRPGPAFGSPTLKAGFNCVIVARLYLSFTINHTVQWHHVFFLQCAVENLRYYGLISTSMSCKCIAVYPIDSHQVGVL